MRKRLKPNEAELLGFETKPNLPDGNAKYSINKGEWDRILEFRISNNSNAEPEKPVKTELSEPKPFVLSAWNNNTGKILDINEYCSVHNLPREDVRSYKLITHTAIPYYNIQFREKELDESSLDVEFVKLHLQNALNFKVDSKEAKLLSENIGVIKIADLHYGALVQNLLRTPDYNPNILAEKLSVAAEKINGRGFDIVHVHFQGDLIESFSGLSHKNSWKSMDVNIIGAQAVKGCVELLHKHFLSKINNVGEIKIVAGNHDRVTSDNKEDENGDAANLIAWGLELIGYNVEFNSNIITHEVSGVNHIILHGHNIVSKRPTKEIIWDYGKQGMFNLVIEGHLHSIIEKLSVSQRNSFQTTKDDSIDHRRIICPSFFTGNSYSERLNFFSNSGFMIVSAYEGIPEIDYRIV
jgi:hypothetical protein